MSRPAKAGLMALGLTGLLLLVALAAQGGHPTRDGRISTRAVPATVQDSLVTLLAVAYALVLVGIIIVVFRQRGWQEPKDSRWLRKFWSVLALMLLLTLVGSWVIRHTHYGQENERNQRGAGQAQTPGSPQRPRTDAVQTRRAEFQWPLVLGLGGLVLLAGVLVVVSRRRDVSPGTEPEAAEEALARAVELTIDDLRSEPDPRRAVIAAYARMEGALASHGLARRRSEAPLEYLARILRELDVRESAVQSLTRLFEYAKFSPHDVGEDLRAEAIAALIAVREDLLGEERAAA